MAIYPKELDQNAAYQSHTVHLTGFLFLPKLAQGLITTNKIIIIKETIFIKEIFKLKIYFFNFLTNSFEKKLFLEEVFVKLSCMYSFVFI
jgi:hypothetical protein